MDIDIHDLAASSSVEWTVYVDEESLDFINCLQMWSADLAKAATDLQRKLNIKDLNHALK